MPEQAVRLLVFALAVIVVLKLLQTPWAKGKIGEWVFSVFLRINLDSKRYRILNDISLRLPDGSTTQIDHIVVSPYGIFVIELKNYQGWIFGDERSKVWTQSFGKNRKYTFQNPIRQNYRHVKALAELTGIPDAYFKPVVAFLGGCTIKTIDKLPPNARYTGNAVKYIKSMNEQLIRNEQVDEIVEVIREWQKHGAVSNREHVRNLHNRFARKRNDNSLPGWLINGDPTVEEDTEEPTRHCPRCGKDLVVRTTKKGPNAGQHFLGCSGFPGCRYCESLESASDSGEVVH